MGIKLRTIIGDDPKMSMRYEWFRDLHGLSHDAAVAHARQTALDALPEEWRIVYEVRTMEHLRDDFGIIEDTDND